MENQHFVQETQSEFQKPQLSFFKKYIYLIILVTVMLILAMSYAAYLFVTSSTDQNRDWGLAFSEAALEDWKTYTNEEYGFTFEYPERLGEPSPVPHQSSLDCNSRAYDRIGIVSLGGLGVGISCEPEPPLPDHVDIDGISQEKMAIEGKEVSLFDYVSPVGYHNKQAYIPLSDDTYVTISSSFKGGDQQELDQEVTMDELRKIISTFQFIERQPQSVNLSGQVISFTKPVGTSVIENVEKTLRIYTSGDPYLYTYDAVKIIPKDRAEKLGQKECYYGESGILRECNAAQEYGISLGVVAPSADTFTDKVDESSFPSSTAEILGREVVTYTTGIEGYADTTYFVPLEDGRTLLIKREDYDPNPLDEDEFDVFPSDKQLSRVLKSLSLTSKENESFTYTIGEPYVQARERLTARDWIPTISDVYYTSSGLSTSTDPISDQFPEISYCGSGLDAICNVNFKKRDMVRHLNVQKGGRSGYDIWTVVGSE